jgi:glycerophosphoryl diester phosphodiesterase
MKTMLLRHAAVALMMGSMLVSAPVAAATICPATPEAFARLKSRVLHPDPKHIVVVAHRACHSTAPENTPQAIETCWKMGVEVVENDVRLTKDGHMVIFHDDEISRMTDRWGYVEDQTLAELRRARLKERSGEAGTYLTDQPITTVEEYFAAIKNKVMVNYEIKASGAQFVAMFNESVALARRMGVLDHIIFKIPDLKSHGKTTAKHILQSLVVPDDVMIMPIIWESDTSFENRVTELEAYKGIGYEMPFQHEAYVAPLANDPRLGRKATMMIALQPYWSGGLDDRLAARDPDAAWGRLIDLGADLIMTDRPETLMSYLERKGLRRTVCDN